MIPFPFPDSGFRVLVLPCSSANELQQNSKACSREDYILQILTVLLEIHHVYIWPLWPFVFCLSFVNNSWNNVTTPSTNRTGFWTDLRHQYGISVTESQTFLCGKRPQRRRAWRNGCFRRLICLLTGCNANIFIEIVRPRRASWSYDLGTLLITTRADLEGGCRGCASPPPMRWPAVY